MLFIAVPSPGLAKGVSYLEGVICNMSLPLSNLLVVYNIKGYYLEPKGLHSSEGWGGRREWGHKETGCGGGSWSGLIKESVCYIPLKILVIFVFINRFTTLRPSLIHTCLLGASFMWVSTFSSPSLCSTHLWK